MPSSNRKTTFVRKSQLAQFLAENIDCIPAADLKPGDRTFDMSNVTVGEWPLLALGCIVRVTAITRPGMVIGAAETNGWHWLEVHVDHHGTLCSAMVKSNEFVPRVKEHSGRAAAAEPVDRDEAWGYETDAEPLARDGEHGTCATCGDVIRYQDCPTGGWWVHETHPSDNHDAILGGPA